jgi:dinuclear metal center YbgI/SA1388 family protein
MKIKEITNYLESLAPISSQESYDNSGLIVGDPNQEVSKILVSLDCIEKTVDEAIETGCNMIISHHPIVFRGLKKINGSDYIQHTVIKAIKNDVAIYAIHTNLDNYRYGVNAEIGKRMGLSNLKILAPKNQVLNKLVCLVPNDQLEEVRQAMFDAGAGNIGNYSSCSFSAHGIGTFEPNQNANPFSGEIGKRAHENEARLEVLVPSHSVGGVILAMKNAHPYEEVPYDAYTLINENEFEGAGMYGQLATEMDEVEFLTQLKDRFNCGIIRHTELSGKKIKTVAFCGGAGSFLLSKAKRVKADIFITGDYKYHEFFDAEGEIIIADIGHYESEQYTSSLLKEILTKKFPKFAVQLSRKNTNPIKYF